MNSKFTIRPIILEQRANLETVHIRHHHVKQYQVGRFLLSSLEGKRAVGKGPREASIACEEVVQQ